jgi:hypothetical protein
VGVRRTTDFFDVPKWTDGFFTYGFLTITSLSRIISRDIYLTYGWHWWVILCLYESVLSVD